MIQFALAALILLLLPDCSFAWGPGFHLQLGLSVLEALHTLPPAVAGLLGAFPNDFLYGCIAADITLGKSFAGYRKHCHRWHNARKLLVRAETDAQKACAYGYISHLAADTVAHCYYVPLSIMRSYQTVVLKHAYWEVRFDSFTPSEIWDMGRKVALEHFEENDELLRREIAKTIFSFSTNKKIFNSILLVSRLNNWQRLIATMHDASRFPLSDEEVAEYTELSRQAVFETIRQAYAFPLPEEEPAGESEFKKDPTGRMALKAAEAVRKNLRLLYQSGKISKEAAGEELDEMKKRLRAAISNPAELEKIVSVR